MAGWASSAFSEVRFCHDLLIWKRMTHHFPQITIHHSAAAQSCSSEGMDEPFFLAWIMEWFGGREVVRNMVFSSHVF